MNCPVCHHELHVYLQPALVPGRAPRELGECLTRSCKLYAVTLQPQALAALTGEQIESYGAINEALTQDCEDRRAAQRARA